MPNTNATFEAAFPPRPTFPVVIHCQGMDPATYNLPYLPRVNLAVYEMLGEFLRCFGSDLYEVGQEYTAEEKSQITAQFVFERISAADQRFGKPDHRKIYAERAGVAIWDVVRIIANTIERTRRHDWNHKRPDFFAAAADDACSRMQGAHMAARRALRALQIGQPNATPPELMGQVLEALAGVMECPHVEEVPSLMPAY
jgi:hypothetical protein